MKWFVVFAALTLVACNGEETPTGVDADGDGVLAGDDCDDGNAAVRPGAIEVCNGIDDDCDGDIDEGGVLQTFFVDDDNDGYGDPGASVEACALPDGHVTNDEDCDDTDFDISPDVVERCDDIDHNCDGDPLLDAIGGDYYLLDADGDGYGAAGSEILSCGEVPNRIPMPADPEAVDCNDGDANINPGQAELCSTPGDDNCNGLVNEDPIDGQDLPVDRDGDGYGDASLTAFVCSVGDIVDLDGDGNQDGTAVDNTDDCDDSTTTIRPGADELCDGLDNDCDPATPEDAFATDTLEWWLDSDEDGSGTPSTSLTACEQPVGYARASAGEDCDDADPDRSPSEAETCDGVDNDCDGIPDDNALDAELWYLDFDGDLLGDPAVPPELACTQPGTRVTNDDDCDDVDPAILGPDFYYADVDLDGYGNAAEFIQSCDPVAGYVLNDEDCDDQNPDTSPESLWYLDQDADGFGRDDATTTSCLEPPGYSDLGGDCEDGNPNINPGVQDGPPANFIDDDCDGFPDDDAVVEHCGTISADEVWAGDSVHLVTCDIIVEGGAQPNLLIESGALVRFEDGHRIVVADRSAGSLQVDGATFQHEDPFAPGSWEGILFGPELNPGVPSYIRNSSFEHVNGAAITIEESEVELDGVSVGQPSLPFDPVGTGVVGDGLLLLGEARATVRNSVFRNNTGVGIRATSADAQLLELTNTTMTGNGETPLQISAGSMSVIDQTNSFTGNVEDVIRLLEGTIEEDATWRGDLGVPYDVVGSITVEGGAAPVLTVQDGVTAMFAPDTGIRIGRDAAGSMDVQGAGLGVVLEGQTAAAGAWDGIRLWENARDTTIAGLTLSDAGAGQLGAIAVLGNELDDPEDRVIVEIADSVVERSASAGVSADYAQIRITDTVLQDNETVGLELRADVVRTGSNFTGSTSQNNQDSGARVYPTLVEILDDGNTYTGNGLPLEVTGGVVVDDAIWRELDEDYYLSGPVLIENVASPIVTIDEGVAIYAGELGEFMVGMNDQGSLVTAGTAANPVLLSALAEFTSNDAVRGAWEGVTYGSFQRNSDLFHTTVEWAGKTTDRGALSFLGDSINTIELDNVTVRESGAHGIFSEGFENETHDLYIHDSTITDNDDIGIKLDLNGLQNRGAGLFSLEGTTVTNNGLNGVTVSADTVQFVSDDNTIGNNNLVTGRPDYIGMKGVDSTGDLLISPRFDAVGDLLPYRLIEEKLRMMNGNVLTVDAGVRIEVDTNVIKNLEITAGADDLAGGIVMDASGGDPIVLTSAEEFPTYGDWLGVTLGSDCITDGPNGNECVLNNVEIEYGGGNFDGVDRGGLEIWVRDFTQTRPVLVTNTTVRYSLSAGIMYNWQIQERPVPNPGGIPTPEFDTYTGPIIENRPSIDVEGFACEDLNGNRVCDAGENRNFCWEQSAVGQHGFTNLLCDNVGYDVFVRTSATSYEFHACNWQGPSQNPYPGTYTGGCP